MGCGCGAKKVSNVVAQPAKTTTSTISTTPENCNITIEILDKWESMLNCVKSNGSFQKTGVAEIVVNQYLGLIQSAKNYPNNYCYYGSQLEVFKSSILTKIVQNEPSCI